MYNTDEQANTLKWCFGVMICANSGFCTLKYCLKFDVRSAILKFGVCSGFAISGPIYEIQKGSINSFHTQILACTFQIRLILNKIRKE